MYVELWQIELDFFYNRYFSNYSLVSNEMLYRDPINKQKAVLVDVGMSSVVDMF